MRIIKTVPWRVKWKRTWNTKWHQAYTGFIEGLQGLGPQWGLGCVTMADADWSPCDVTGFSLGRVAALPPVQQVQAQLSSIYLGILGTII